MLKGGFYMSILPLKKCSKCKHVFADIVRNSSVCPKCGSIKVKSAAPLDLFLYTLSNKKNNENY